MSTEGSRLYYWDNLKAVLMFLVVAGHFTAAVKGSSLNMQRLYFFIHLFHMPVFVFISGVFSKKTVDTGAGMRRKIIGFVILGYAVKFTVLCLELLFGEYDGFSVFREGSVSWYLFALAMWLPLSRALRKADKRLVIAFSVFTACLAGYDESFGTLLALSRVLGFYPFFVLGLMWDPKKVPAAGSAAKKIAGAAGLLVTAAVIYRFADTLMPYTEILRCMKSYFALPKGVNTDFGFWYRILWYAAASAAGICFAAIIPAGKNILSGIGSRTLQILVFHMPLLKLFRFAGGVELLKAAVPGHYRILFVLLSVPLTIVLSLPVFERPVKAFWKLCGE